MSDEYQLRKDIDRIYGDIYTLQGNELDVYKKEDIDKILDEDYYDKSEVDVKINESGGGGGDLSNYYTKSEINGILSSYVTSQTLEDYQPLLESGTNIKTINGESLLGQGNISISGTVDIATSWGDPLSDEKVPSEKLAKNTLDDKVNRSELHNLDINLTTLELVPKNTNPNGVICFDDLQNDYQEKLVSGSNIKTINNQSLLGSGNIDIQGGGGSVIGTGSFSINNQGHLIVELPNAVDNPYFINNQGHLIYDTSNTHNNGS